MIFSEIFKARCPEEVRNTLLVSLAGQTGDALEIAASSTLEKLFYSNTDITTLSQSSLLNYLAFLGVTVSTVLPASASLVIQNTNKTSVTFSLGDSYASADGRFWTVSSAKTIRAGETGTILLRQYTDLSYQSVYNDVLVFPETGVVVDSLGVRMTGADLPVAKDFTNGFVAYLASDRVFVKVYAGDNTPDPQGQEVLVSYRKTDGFLDAGEPTFPVNEWIGGLVLVSSAFENGSAAPSLSELQSLFRVNVLSNNKLVRKSDYRDFVEQDSRVAEAAVVGDYERRQATEKFDPTGIVEILAVGTDLKPISATLQKSLLESMDPYRDISIVEFSDPAPVGIRNYVFYNSADAPDGEFQALVTRYIDEQFDYATVRSSGGSLFAGLDISQTIKSIIGSVYSPSYFAIRFAFEEVGTVAKGSIYNFPLPVPELLEPAAVAIWDTDTNEVIARGVLLADELGIYPLVNKENVEIGILNYSDGSANFTNTFGKDLNFVIVKALADVAKVTLPTYRNFRVNSGIRFYKGIEPRAIQELAW